MPGPSNLLKFKIVNVAGHLAFELSDFTEGMVRINDRRIMCNCIGEPYVSEIVDAFNKFIKQGESNEMERSI